MTSLMQFFLVFYIIIRSLVPSIGLRKQIRVFCIHHTLDVLMMSLMIVIKKHGFVRTVVISLTSAGGPGGRGLGSPVRGGV